MFKNALSQSFALLNTQDEFLSEFTLKENNDIFNITGFTGSNGIALIEINSLLKFLKNAQESCINNMYFFTDGRYMLQSQNEISPHFQILSILNLFEHLKILNPQKIFLDFKKNSYKFINSLQKTLPHLSLKDITDLEIDKISKPITVNKNFFELNNAITGKTKKSKIKEIQDFLCQNNKDGFFVSNVQNVCWLLNIRGSDEKFTPIYKNTLLIKKDEYFLSPDLKKITGNIFIENDITYFQYINIDANKEFSNFITEKKAIKNNVEIDGMINAHKIDGKCLTKFLLWLEDNYLHKTEWDISEKLLEFRKKSEYFKMPSFPTICGVNENGAIIHYNPTQENAKIVKENSILLIDSGGQYADLSGKQKILGTTDVTRTVFLGKEPPNEYKKAFTLVLKGHIAIAMAKFNLKTPSNYFDYLARKPLQENNMDYPHSTGHGVGAFLSVHEAGCGFSQKNTSSLKNGMIISNEPGYYLENKFGIRIESLVLVKNNKNIIENKLNAIIFAVKEFVGNGNVIIGLSGGADSTLVATISRLALDKKQISCVFMPSKYTSKESENDAFNLVKNLDINIKTVDIQPIFENFSSHLNVKSIALENLQARIRGTILTAIANETNALILTTGNKSEIATGYCTLYGDMNGAFNPIKDLYKTEVFGMMNYINERYNNIIPQNIIDKEPSAELKENQKDSDFLPKYDILDDILIQLIEENKSIEEVVNHPQELVKQVFLMLKKSEFKRWQACPGVKLSCKSFEKNDWQFNLN